MTALVDFISQVPGDNLKIGIRPEFVHVSGESVLGAYEADISHVEDLGTYKIMTFRLGGETMKARLDEDQEVPSGKAYVSFPKQWLKLYVDEYLVEDTYDE